MDTSEIQAKAEQLMQSRLNVAVEAGAAQGRVIEARAALDQAEREHASAWKAAQDAGWTTTELRSMGVSAPGRRPPGRPRKAQAPKRDAAPPPSAEPPQDGSVGTNAAP